MRSSAYHTAPQHVVLRVGYLTGLGELLKPKRHGLCRVMVLNFGEFLPTFMCVVQARILDDAHEGRGWLENSCR